jgi:hypothetical protein
MKLIYKVITGIFEGTEFEGRYNCQNDTIINLDTIGQAYPAINCELIAPFKVGTKFKVVENVMLKNFNVGDKYFITNINNARCLISKKLKSPFLKHYIIGIHSLLNYIQNGSVIII